MKSLKHIFAFIVPLTAMLVTFGLYLITNGMVTDYKEKISNDYSIVIVTHTPLIKENLNQIASIDVKKIVTLKKESILNNIKTDLSTSSMKLLKQKLPHFYQIYLEDFPTSHQLTQIKESLKNNKNIKKVEIFSKNHNQTYLLLLMINNIIVLLFAVILIFAMIILSKQITIWFYEHHERIAIFQLHGASILYSASTVLKYAMIGAFLSSIIVSSLLLFVNNNLNSLVPIELSSIINTQLNFQYEVAKIFALSFGISIVTIIGVLFKYKVKNG
jgi:cell division transport system permease protein